MEKWGVETKKGVFLGVSSRKMVKKGGKVGRLPRIFFSSFFEFGSF